MPRGGSEPPAPRFSVKFPAKLLIGLGSEVISTPSPGRKGSHGRYPSYFPLSFLPGMGNEQLLFRLELIAGGEFSEAVQGLPLILHRVGLCTSYWKARDRRLKVAGGRRTRCHRLHGNREMEGRPPRSLAMGMRHVEE